ncbi:hypothetical protein QJS10_CPA16g00940 [Acorus calamus]|uniref:Uncharacterized protein n=1 Tax=Acorus calamus TaxID=4465 RepID=A0AAV9CXU8_ACOCL|nr:hypothetical protein QJS10_CPA16g00940 [Acorus calamus]
MRGQDQQSRLFYELCSLLLGLLRSPPIPISHSDHHHRLPPPTAVAPGRRGGGLQQVTPAAFASLLLGVSMALMLCGSVTFVIGFILMPWVLGLVMVFYMVGVVSNLSGIGRAILCPASTSAGDHSTPSRKEMSGQLLSKLPIL